MSRMLRLLWVLALGHGMALAAEQERIIESIVPALAYGPKCSSVVELRNLSERLVAVTVEGHRPSGALVGMTGHASNTVRLRPGERAHYHLDLDEETNSAWVRVAERVPSARLSPVVAVSAKSECVVDNQLRTVGRDVAFPMRNPWFSSEVAELHGGVITLINTSERVARAVACYSSGGLFSVPGSGRAGDLQPICTTSYEVQIAPFGSREFPVEREGTSHFSLRTLGDAIVLEMLRPVEENVRVYAVDSSIRFGEEVPEPGRPNSPVRR